MGSNQNSNFALTTIIYTGEAKWGRPTYIKLVNDKVVYDNSDEEYGPTEFDIKTLIEALNKHLDGTKGNSSTIHD